MLAAWTLRGLGAMLCRAIRTDIAQHTGELLVANDDDMQAGTRGHMQQMTCQDTCKTTRNLKKRTVMNAAERSSSTGSTAVSILSYSITVYPHDARRRAYD